MSKMTNVAHNEHLECEVKATHNQNNRKHPQLGFIVFFYNICILILDKYHVTKSLWSRRQSRHDTADYLIALQTQTLH